MDQPPSTANGSHPTSLWRRLGMPTWTLLVANYSLWILLTWYATRLPWWLLLVAGGFSLALQGSLQHEALHRHPTRHVWLNTLLVWAPLTLWIPYQIYRESHLQHHRSDTLTHPDRDTESYYVMPATWQRLPAVARGLLRFNQTLLGRLTLGPWLVVARFWAAEGARLAGGDFRHLPAWLLQLAGCGLIYLWVTTVNGLPFWQYLLLFAWPGLSLTLLRSFHEHRPAATQGHRTGVIEGDPLTRLMFLNNNYHVTHHENPGLPWFELRARYRSDPVAVSNHNGGFLLPGYWTLARRYGLSAKDSPVYPDLDTVLVRYDPRCLNTG